MGDLVVISVDVRIEPQSVLDLQNFLRKLDNWIGKGQTPPGVYATMHWMAEEAYEKNFRFSGQNTKWKASKRSARLGGKPLIASGNLQKSLGHNPGGLGIRNNRTGEFASTLPYGSNFDTQHTWTPTENTFFDVPSSQYRASSEGEPSLYKAGTTYNIPGRGPPGEELLDLTTADVAQFQRLMGKWAEVYATKGMHPYFRVIESNVVTPI